MSHRSASELGPLRLRIASWPCAPVRPLVVAESVINRRGDRPAAIPVHGRQRM